MVPSDPPPAERFTARERALVARLRTPKEVQRWLDGLPYNHERHGETYRSFRQVVVRGTAHCGEAALAAATILEQHGYEPRILTFDSIDGLGHVLFLYRSRGLYGTVARSRDPGLHGRRPRYRNLRSLSQSYAEPYVDLTGAISGYAVFDLRKLPPGVDWRFSSRNVFAFERVLNELPMKKVRMPPDRLRRLRRRYEGFLRDHPGQKPVYYRSRPLWL